MYLVFDTETTGLPLWDEEPYHPRQARICQLAALLVDSGFREVAYFYSLVKPDGWTISEGAYNAHQIPQSRCEEYGIPISNVLSMFDSLMEKADLAIAYNIKFDAFLLDTEQILRTDGMSVRYDWNKDGYCAMLAATPICGLRQTNGRPKWPKLGEAYKHLMGRELINAHDALADCRATLEVFKALQRKVVTV